jgi:hypothetical protein
LRRELSEAQQRNGELEQKVKKQRGEIRNPEDELNGREER